MGMTLITNQQRGVGTLGSLSQLEVWGGGGSHDKPGKMTASPVMDLQNRLPASLIWVDPYL